MGSKLVCAALDCCNIAQTPGAKMKSSALKIVYERYFSSGTRCKPASERHRAPPCTKFSANLKPGTQNHVLCARGMHKGGFRAWKCSWPKEGKKSLREVLPERKQRPGPRGPPNSPPDVLAYPDPVRSPPDHNFVTVVPALSLLHTSGHPSTQTRDESYASLGLPNAATLGLEGLGWLGPPEGSRPPPCIQLLKRTQDLQQLGKAQAWIAVDEDEGKELGQEPSSEESKTFYKASERSELCETLVSAAASLRRLFTIQAYKNSRAQEHPESKATTIEPSTEP
eukprot:1143194-Pelagomonas_calceolata.AAC.4